MSDNEQGEKGAAQQAAAPTSVDSAGESAGEERVEKTKGHVKWFNCTKGFGFITVDGTDDEVFVHQSNIVTDGFRSLREGEPVEFDLVIGEDEKKKAFHVTGPDGSRPQGYQASFQHRGAMTGVPVGIPPMEAAGYVAGMGTYPHAGQTRISPGTPTNQGVPAGYFPHVPPEAFMGYYPMPPGPTYQAYSQTMMHHRGRGGFYPGGQNWVGARPPPPGQPGFSSGLQVVVHNLPWDCTQDELKNAFSDCGEIERADVVVDSKGRSRGFGIVRFPDRASAERAVERMNNQDIGGRVVSVRVDRFA